MALVDVECKICGETFSFDMGEKSLEEVKDVLGKRDCFQCPGHHFENASPLAFLIFGKIHDGKAPSDEEWYKQMCELHGKLYSSDELPVEFEVSGFSCGMCVARDKKSGNTVYLDFKPSPSGKRYYYRN